MVRYPGMTRMSLPEPLPLPVEGLKGVPHSLQHLPAQERHSTARQWGHVNWHFFLAIAERQARVKWLKELSERKTEAGGRKLQPSPRTNTTHAPRLGSFQLLCV